MINSTGEHPKISGDGAQNCRFLSLVVVERVLSPDIGKGKNQ